MDCGHYGLTVVHQELVERDDGPAIPLVRGDLPHAHLHRWRLQRLLHRVAARYVLLHPVGVRARVRVRVRVRVRSRARVRVRVSPPAASRC